MTVPLYNLTDTWNDGATVFTAILMNVTDSASDPTSLLMDLQVGSSSKFSVTKAGAAKANTFLLVPSNSTTVYNLRGTSFATSGMNIDTSGAIHISGDGSGDSAVFGTALQLPRTAAQFVLGPAGTTQLNQEGAANTSGIVGQRYTTVSQTYRLYNTFTNTSNYERGGFDWTTTANIFRIRSEAIGTGTIRNIAIDAYSKSGAPTATELPAGTWGVFKDSGGGSVVIAYNDGGTIKTAALT